jgi:hypothetical protein
LSGAWLLLLNLLLIRIRPEIGNGVTFSAGFRTLRCRGVLNSAGACCSLDSCQRNKNRVKVTELEQPKLLSVDISQFFLVHTCDNSVGTLWAKTRLSFAPVLKTGITFCPRMLRSNLSYFVRHCEVRRAYNPGLSGTLGSFSKLGWFLGARTRMGLRPRLRSFSFVSHGFV